MENMEALLLMICTFQMKKNVQQYMAMVSRLFSTKFICFVVNHLIEQPPTIHFSYMSDSNTNIHMNMFLDNRIRPKLLL